MFAIFLGCFAFFLFFLYDYNSILWQNKWLKSFFFLGCLLLVIATMTLLIPVIFNSNDNNWLTPIGLFFSILFFGLLIYTLFLPCPFKKLIVKTTKSPKYVKPVSMPYAAILVFYGSSVFIFLFALWRRILLYCWPLACIVFVIFYILFFKINGLFRNNFPIMRIIKIKRLFYGLLAAVCANVFVLCERRCNFCDLKKS